VDRWGYAAAVGGWLDCRNDLTGALDQDDVLMPLYHQEDKRLSARPLDSGVWLKALKYKRHLQPS
jgi:hypothetical protein